MGHHVAHCSYPVRVLRIDAGGVADMGDPRVASPQLTQSGESGWGVRDRQTQPRCTARKPPAAQDDVAAFEAAALEHLPQALARACLIESASTAASWLRFVQGVVQLEPEFRIAEQSRKFCARGRAFCVGWSAVNNAVSGRGELR